MAIQIGAKPDSGFDDPIGMLKDSDLINFVEFESGSPSLL